MKVIIAGSRTITDYDALCQCVSRSGFRITEVVSGGANGVDRLGERFASESELPCKIFPANWNDHGRSAGIIRNVHMAKYADAAIVLHVGSPGSKHMIQEAERRGLRIHEERYDG